MLTLEDDTDFKFLRRVWVCLCVCCAIVGGYSVTVLLAWAKYLLRVLILQNLLGPICEKKQRIFIQEDECSEWQSLKKPIHSSLRCKVNPHSRKPLDLRSRTGAVLAEHSLDSRDVRGYLIHCCSSFGNTTNVTGTSKTRGSLKWESCASPCLTHCGSFTRMNASLWHKRPITAP